jgi:hypothetical protein
MQWYTEKEGESEDWRDFFSNFLTPGTKIQIKTQLGRGLGKIQMKTARIRINAKIRKILDRHARPFSGVLMLECLVSWALHSVVNQVLVPSRKGWAEDWDKASYIERMRQIWLSLLDLCWDDWSEQQEVFLSSSEVSACCKAPLGVEDLSSRHQM